MGMRLGPPWANGTQVLREVPGTQEMSTEFQLLALLSSVRLTNGWLCQLACLADL